jgi:hypothetical protein
MEDEDALRAIASSSPADTAEKAQRVQKTFVVSQKFLTTLAVITKHSQKLKNWLIEGSEYPSSHLMR